MNADIIIALNNDLYPSIQINYKTRYKNLKLIHSINKIIKIEDNYLNILESINPDFIIKSSDPNYSKIENKFCKNNNCEFIFTSGHNFEKNLLPKKYIKNSLSDFIKRHNIKKDLLIKKINSFKSLKVAVFGDTIIDEYLYCDSVGVSQEDSNTIYSVTKEEISLGGAFFVASLISTLGDKTFFFTTLPSEEKYLQLIYKNKNKNLEIINYKDSNKKGVIKTRFKYDQKNIFRLSKIDDLQINNTGEFLFIDYLNKIIDNLDLIIFSDFNYGTISKSLFNKVYKIASKKKIPIFADSQSSSQVGNLDKYKNCKLITPTEYEARLMLSSNDGLALLANNVLKKLNPDNLIITLGKDGILIRNNSEKLNLDILPAFNNSPKDVSGAGDAFFAISSLSMASGLDIWNTSILGSLAAAEQIKFVGHKLITNKILVNLVNKI